LEKSRKRAHSSCRVSSSLCTTHINTNKKWLKDEVISDLNVCVFKLETDIQVLARERNEEYRVLHFNDEFSSLGRDFIDSLNILFHDLIKPHDSDEDISNDYLVEDELRLCLEDEERMRLEQETNIIEDQRFRMEEANRMRLEEDNFQPGQLKCKFLWSEDYTVVQHFWLTLACLDPRRKDLWVDYMWHGRPENANWAMISCYFVQLLLQNITPLFYANGDKYATPWSDVDQIIEHTTMSQLARLANFAKSILMKDMMVKLFEVDNERDFRIVRETYAMCQALNVRCEERREQIIEM
ncbi:hypothetical protein Tco_1341121, partial [Tanacetum coccineum]